MLLQILDRKDHQIYFKFFFKKRVIVSKKSVLVNVHLKFRNKFWMLVKKQAYLTFLEVNCLNQDFPNGGDFSKFGAIISKGAKGGIFKIKNF